MRIKHKLPFFFLIVVSASFFRITNLDLIEFKADEAINLLIASRPLFGHSIPYGGTVSSLGILNPPLFNYLLFPIVFITLDPKIVSLSIGIINSIAVGFLFLLIKRYYGLSTGLIATILLAFSPWALVYSRKIWMQDLLVPLSIPFLYSIHKIVVDQKMFYWIIFFASSLFLLQLHPTSILFILPISIFLLSRKIKVKLKYIIIGLVIGILPLLPYINYQLFNRCPDCKAFVAAKNKLSVKRSLETFSRPFQIIGQGNFNYLIGRDMITFKNKYPLVYGLRSLLYIVYLILPIGVFVFIKKITSLRFLAYSAIILPFAYYFLKIEPFMHYYIIILPLLYLFLAVGFNYFMKKAFFLRLVSLTILIITLLTYIMFNAAFFNLLKIKGSLEGDYGESLMATAQSRKEKLSKYKNLPDYNEVFLSSYLPLRYAFGYLPLGKMLYLNSYAPRDRIEVLEKKLKDSPGDPRIALELFALYTKNPPTPDAIDVLRNKRNENQIYEIFYKEMNQDYLSKNLKKLYESEQLSYLFYYPEHWKIKEKGKQITIMGDGYETSIFFFPKKTSPIYSQLEIEQGKYLTITVKFKNNDYIVRSVNVIDEIISSIKTIEVLQI